MAAGTFKPGRQTVATTDLRRGTNVARRVAGRPPQQEPASGEADAAGGALQRADDSPQGGWARTADALDGVLARAVAARAAADDFGVGPADAARPTAPMLQRSYHLWNFGTNEWDQITDAWAELKDLKKLVNTSPALADIKDAWNARPKEQLLQALKRMMAVDARGTKSGILWEAVGWHAHSRAWYFGGRDKAARAVLGESNRAGAEAKETDLANQVLGTGPTALSIRRDMRSYGQKVIAALNYWVSTNEIAADTGSKTQRYGYYYNPVTLWGAYKVGPRKALEDAVAAGSMDVVKAISAITDLCSALFKQDEAFFSVAPDQAKASNPSGVEDIDDVRSKKTETMIETSASMRYARSHNMLVDVGPSYTTGRLLKLGEHVGATDREQTAVALALFAFWNRHYWRAASGIHHFHFVMDMLQNFVPGRYKYQGYPADISEVYDFDNVDITVDVDPGGEDKEYEEVLD